MPFRCLRPLGYGCRRNLKNVVARAFLGGLGALAVGLLIAAAGCSELDNHASADVRGHIDSTRDNGCRRPGPARAGDLERHRAGRRLGRHRPLRPDHAAKAAGRVPSGRPGRPNQQQFGPYQSHGDPQDVQRGDITVVNVPLQMEREPGQFRLSVHPDGTIAGLFFLKEGVPVP